MSKYHDYYDRLNAGKKNYADEINRIINLYQNSCNQKMSRVLEIGSGTGNHTIELARYFSKICAVDIDPEMIEIAKPKSEAISADIEFYHDVHHVPYLDFPLCVMMWHVLNYFPTITMMENIFKIVRAKLSKDGLYVFDAWNGVAVLRDLPRTTKNKIEVDGLTLIHELNGSTSIMDQKTLILNKVEVYQNDELVDQFSREVTHYIWTPKTVVELLKRTGFRDIEIVKTTDYTQLANEDDWKICFIARKK